MIWRREVPAAAVCLMTLAALCIGCGPRKPAAPGGAFTDPSQPGTRSSRPAGAPALPAPGTEAPAGALPAGGTGRADDASSVPGEVDDYVQRAREYEQQQEDLRQQELESAPPSDMWVPMPEAPEEAELTETSEEEEPESPSS